MGIVENILALANKIEMQSGLQPEQLKVSGGVWKQIARAIDCGVVSHRLNFSPGNLGMIGYLTGMKLIIDETLPDSVVIFSTKTFDLHTDIMFRIPQGVIGIVNVKPDIAEPIVVEPAKKKPRRMIQI